LSSSARCSPSGWTSGREALDFGPEDLGPLDFGPAAVFRGAGMGVIWGDSGVGGRGGGKPMGACGMVAAFADLGLAGAPSVKLRTVFRMPRHAGEAAKHYETREATLVALASGDASPTRTIR
jgi:hypothetical protein